MVIDGIDLDGDVEGYPYEISADIISLSIEGYFYLYGNGSAFGECSGDFVIENLAMGFSFPGGSLNIDIASSIITAGGTFEIIPQGEGEPPLIIIDGQVEWYIQANADWDYEADEFLIFENFSSNGNISVNGTITIDINMDGDIGNLTVDLLFDGNIQIDQLYINGTIPLLGNIPVKLNIENLSGTGMFEIHLDVYDGSITLNNQIPDLDWDCFEIDVGNGLIAGEIYYFYGDITLDLVDNGDWDIHSREGFDTLFGISFSSNGGADLGCDLTADLQWLVKI